MKRALCDESVWSDLLPELVSHVLRSVYPDYQTHAQQYHSLWGLRPVSTLYRDTITALVNQSHTLPAYLMQSDKLYRLLRQKDRFPYLKELTMMCGQKTSLYAECLLPHASTLCTLKIGCDSQRDDSYLSTLACLTSLAIYTFSPVTLEAVASLTRLTTLSLDDRGTTITTDTTLNRLTGLTSLKLTGGNSITGSGIRALTRLRNLDVSASEARISNDDLLVYTNLVGLCTGVNTEITCVTQLPLLTSLTLFSCIGLTDDELGRLTGLTRLRLVRHSHNISDQSLSRLTNLTELGLGNCQRVSSKTLAGLPYLRELCLACSHIQSRHEDWIVIGSRLTTLMLGAYTGPTACPHRRQLALLTNLTNLIMGGRTDITDCDISQLTRLQQLSLRYNTQITDSGLCCLTNLHTLNLGQNTRVTHRSIHTLRALTSLTLDRDYMRLDGGLPIHYSGTALFHRMPTITGGCVDDILREAQRMSGSSSSSPPPLPSPPSQSRAVLFLTQCFSRDVDDM